MRIMRITRIMRIMRIREPEMCKKNHSKNNTMLCILSIPAQNSNVPGLVIVSKIINSEYNFADAPGHDAKIIQY